MAKIIAWIRANGASLIAAIQALLKAVKELLTAMINLLSIFMSVTEWRDFVGVVRAGINEIDAWLEIIKGKLLDVMG